MKSLSDEQIVKNLGKLYNIVLSLRKDDDYEINQEQMDKLCALYRFFLDSADKLDGKAELCKLVPKEEHGGVTATFLVFDVYGDNVKKFAEVISHCSAIGIDSLADGQICIGCTIPNVFVKKSN